jgi:hypothetical protein
MRPASRQEPRSLKRQGATLRQGEGVIPVISSQPRALGISPGHSLAATGGQEVGPAFSATCFLLSACLVKKDHGGPGGVRTLDLMIASCAFISNQQLTQRDTKRDNTRQTQHSCGSDACRVSLCLSRSRQILVTDGGYRQCVPPSSEARLFSVSRSFGISAPFLSEADVKRFSLARRPCEGCHAKAAKLTSVGNLRKSG